jgi:hypothetical protein
LENSHAYIYIPKKCSNIILTADLAKLHSDLQGLKCWRAMMKLKWVQ